VPSGQSLTSFGPTKCSLFSTDLYIYICRKGGETERSGRRDFHAYV
jgi:hypothetical protein